MSLAAFRQKYDDFYAPRFRVRVGDDEIRESDGVISDLLVDSILDGADRFTFVERGGFDRAARRFTSVDWDRLRPETPVRIRLGYGNVQEPVFAGRIQSIRPEFPANGEPTVEVSGYGMLHDLTRGTNSRSWDESSDAAIAREVVSEYAFDRVVVDETGRPRQKVIQDDQSDYEFLRELADRNGFELFADRETLYFRAPKREQSPELTLEYGDSLASFSPEFNEADQVGTVEVRHWDPSAKREIVGSADRDGGTGTRVVRVPVASRDEAEAAAAAALERLSAELIEGSGDTVGLPELRAGTTVRLEGLGEMFTRTYYVIRSTHRIGTSGYETGFEVTERAL